MKQSKPPIALLSIVALSFGAVLFFTRDPNGSGPTKDEILDGKKTPQKTPDKSATAASLANQTGKKTSKIKLPDDDLELKSNKLKPKEGLEKSSILLYPMASRGTGEAPSASSPHTQWFKEQATQDLK